MSVSTVVSAFTTFAIHSAAWFEASVALKLMLLNCSTLLSPHLVSVWTDSVIYMLSLK